MGSTIRTKIINSQEYLYEITHYYDPASKRTRQRSRYLSKSIDGEPVRVRNANRIPRLTFAYGEYLPFLAILDALHLEELLQEEISFVIPAPLTLKQVKEVLTEAQRDLESPQYLQMYQQDPIFVKPVTLTIQGIPVS